jgi:predicted TIM-barrel fold metal-dependent hydrolase
MREYRVISADSHLETPPEQWTERMPHDLRELAPRTVALDGGDGWAMGDDEPIPMGLNVTGGQKYSEFKNRGRSFREQLPGTRGPAQRLAEQDQDGDDAEVLFCSVAATALTRMTNARLIAETAHAYNDWLSDYCSYAPDRLFGMAVIPHSSIDDAVAELHRIARKPGIRGAQLLRFPSGANWGTSDDEPFWAAASDLGVTIVGHHNFGGEQSGKSHALAGLKEEKALQIEGNVDLASFAWLLTSDLPIPTLPILTIEQLFLGGVLDRHPKLRFHFAETGIGWLPYWLEQMDDRYDRHRHWAKVDLKRRPREYVREHFTFSFQEDHAGIALRHSIGIDNICWATDFPHAVGDWPWSRETRARMMKDVPPSERRKIEALNIASQLNVISASEKEELARRADGTEEVTNVPARGARRSPEAIAV